MGPAKSFKMTNEKSGILKKIPIFGQCGLEKLIWPAR